MKHKIWIIVLYLWLLIRTKCSNLVIFPSPSIWLLANFITIFLLFFSFIQNKHEHTQGSVQFWWCKFTPNKQPLQKNMHETCHPKLSMHISKRRATSLIKASPLIQDLFRNEEPKMVTLKLVLPTWSIPSNQNKKGHDRNEHLPCN